MIAVWVLFALGKQAPSGFSPQVPPRLTTQTIMVRSSIFSKCQGQQNRSQLDLSHHIDRHANDSGLQNPPKFTALPESDVLTFNLSTEAIVDTIRNPHCERFWAVLTSATLRASVFNDCTTQSSLLLSQSSRCQSFRSSLPLYPLRHLFSVRRRFRLSCPFLPDVPDMWPRLRVMFLWWFLRCSWLTQLTLEKRKYRNSCNRSIAESGQV
jgi:hypothetical protein